MFVLYCFSLSFGQVRHEDLPPQNRPTELTVSGRVVDAKGKPVPDAQVVVAASERARSARPLGIYIKNGLPYMTEVIGPTKTDREGRYQIQVPKSLSGLREGLDVFAAARNHGYAMERVAWDGDQTADLRLPEEHVVRGRVVDLKGQPIAGALIRVLLSDPGKGQERDGWWRSVLKAWHPHGLDVWRSVRSDDKGRFLVRGLGSGDIALQFEERTSTSHHQLFETVPIETIKNVTIALSPAKNLYGLITYADSGHPWLGQR